jgi:hypothetical protein
MRRARAIISWVPRTKGGRTAPPAGPVYSTVCRFADDTGWPNTAWSLVLQRLQPYAQGRYWFAEVHFLAPAAPEGLLRSGARFELYEGRRLVATGQVKGVAARPPVDERPLVTALLG